MSVICPRCREASVHKSHRQPIDFLPRLFGMVALRCNLCERRFFRLRSSLPDTADVHPTSSRPVRVPASH